MILDLEVSATISVALFAFDTVNFVSAGWFGFVGPLMEGFPLAQVSSLTCWLLKKILDVFCYVVEDVLGDFDLTLAKVLGAFVLAPAEVLGAFGLVVDESLILVGLVLAEALDVVDLVLSEVRGVFGLFLAYLTDVLSFIVDESVFVTFYMPLTSLYLNSISSFVVSLNCNESATFRN